jgi:hypothetical protein
LSQRTVNRCLIAVVVASMAILGGCARGVTSPPRSVEGISVQAVGTVLTDAGGNVEYWVRYGPTTAYGSETQHQTIALAKGQSTGVRLDIGGLTRSTTYHHQLCARDASQSTPLCGEDIAFKTQSVNCQDIVTQDVKLTADMDCHENPAPGWGIGADGVDIDLAGHMFRGSPTRVGIADSGWDDLTIHDGALDGWLSGISLDGASRISIVRVLGGRTDISGGEGIEIRHSDTRLIAGDTDGLVVADSTATGGGNPASPGLLLLTDGARLVRNRVQGANFQPAIAIFGDENRVLRNHVVGPSMVGIVINSGAGNAIEDNELAGGVILPDSPTDSAGDGIFVGGLRTGATLLRGNVASDNDGDGIETQSPSTRLGYNTATGNGDFGIDAAAGVTDLGGNAASQNGNPLQCRNVFCQ